MDLGHQPPSNAYLLEFVQQSGIPCLGIEPTADDELLERLVGLR
jgi:hypothetical protein